MGSEPRTAFDKSAGGWEAEDGHHYTVAELAEAWNVSDDFVRDLFADERDVLRWFRNRRGRRRYVVLRIPAPVAERVYRRAQGRAGSE
jgi:hypothetical protein